MSQLVPDHTETPSFEDEDDGYEYEYESTYVTLDLGSIDQNLLLNATSFRLIGLDSPTPYLQLPGATLKGAHESLIGSELIFAEGRDPDNRSRRFVTHVGTTSQRIQFHPVQLRIKALTSQNEADSSVGRPVLFQGVKKKARTAAPTEKRPRGRPSKAETVPKEKKVPKKRGKGKGKAKASKVPVHEEEAHHTDGSGWEDEPTSKEKAPSRPMGSDSESEPDYDIIDDGHNPGEPGPSTRRESLRRQPARPVQQQNLGILDSLESIDPMDVD